MNLFAQVNIEMKLHLTLFGVFICLVGLVALAEFSQIEGYRIYSSYSKYNSDLNAATINNVGTSIGNVKVIGNTITPRLGTNNDPTWKKYYDERINTNPTIIIHSNLDFMNAVNARLSVSPDFEKDRTAIYNIQTGLTNIQSKNAATMLGEIGDNQNIRNPRLFLQYMNWFGSNCPVDSDNCPGFSN